MNKSLDRGCSDVYYQREFKETLIYLTNIKDGIIQKKDYWSIVLFTWVFIGCYFLSKELTSNNLLVVLPVSGLGAFVGYKLGDWVTDKSKGTKVFLVVLWSVMLFGALQLINNRKNDGKKTYRSDKINLLTGKWETDEDEGFKIT
jgi:hypothetical protein